MSRFPDPPKRAAWRERFERFSDSRLSVARFCTQERVSVASFYHWRKKLGAEAAKRRRPVRGEGFQPVAVVPAPSAGVPATAGVAIVLSGGTRIEVDAAHLDAVRTVIAEIARLDRGPAGARVDRGGQRVAKEPRENKRKVLCAKTAQKRGRRRRHRVRDSRSTAADRDPGVDGGGSC